MNNKVTEAQKKREEMNAVEKEAYDKATGDKLASAEERRTMLCEETRQKASAEVAKVRIRQRLQHQCLHVRYGPMHGWAL